MIELDKLMKLLEVTTDKELAAKLGHLSPSTISNWRSRGAVPKKALREWSLRYGKPEEWFHGEDETVVNNKPLESQLRRLVDSICDEVLATVQTPKEELDLIEDFLAFRRKIIQKKHGGEDET